MNWYDLYDRKNGGKYTKEIALSFIKHFNGVNYVTLDKLGHITLWEYEPTLTKYGWNNQDYDIHRITIYTTKYTQGKIKWKKSLFSSKDLEQYELNEYNNKIFNNNIILR